MKRPVYLACVFLTSCLVAAMIGWSVSAGNLLVPVLALPLGIIVVLACRAHVEEVIRDERENKIRSRAALRTLEVILIGGAIVAVILLAYGFSTSLSPVITGKVVIQENGTKSLIIAEYRPGNDLGPEYLVRSAAIHDIDAMNESEALTYCAYIREGFRQNESRGLVGMTIAGTLAAVLIIFGAFYLYYNRKY